MGRKIPEYWPPKEERQALRRRLAIWRPIATIIACALWALLAWAVWVSMRGVFT